MSEQNIAFLLTKEELFYSLRLVNLPNIPGLGVEPFKNIDEAILEKVMEVISRVLVARQLLIADENKGFRLDKVLNTVLSVCAKPEKMVVLMFANKQEVSKKTYFYSSTGFDVRQDVLFSDLYQFQIDADVDLGKDVVLGVLNSQVERLDTEFTKVSYSVSNNAFESARSLADDNAEESAMLLIELGIEENHANSLVSIFAEPDFRFTMQYLYRSDDNPNHKVVSVISKGDAWWIVTAETPSNETLVVEKTKKSSVIEIVSEAYRALGVEV